MSIIRSSRTMVFASSRKPTIPIPVSQIERNLSLNRSSKAQTELSLILGFDAISRDTRVFFKETRRKTL